MLVVIKGAGDIASGIAVRLWHAGFDVVMTEIAKPTAIRRTVSFSDAVRLGQTQVEDITAVHAENEREALAILEQRRIPVLVDPEAKCTAVLRPDVLVDAVLAKKNLGTTISDAFVVIGVGPGFRAGKDCHAVIETKRGHNLGRVIWDGPASVNTGIPGTIAGVSEERVLRAPADGIFEPCREITAHVNAGETIAAVDGEPMKARISGVLRGLLPEGTFVHRGMKAGDIDPRDDASYCKTVSDKARSVGGGVLEAILEQSGLLRTVGR